jgi:hypothetical protein
VPCRAVPCRAVPCRAVPCRAVPCRAVPCRAVPVPCQSELGDLDDSLKTKAVAVRDELPP